MKKFLLSVLAGSVVLMPALSFAAGSALSVRTEQASLSSVPLGAQRIEMLTLHLAASCDADVSIASITLHHQGLGNTSDLLRVYAMEGNRRMTRSATFNEDDQSVTLRLRAFTVDSCTERTLRILSDISPTATAGGEHRIVLLDSTDIETTSDVSIETPQSSTTPARTTPAGAGVISVEYPELSVAVKYGKKRVIGRVLLSADGVDDHLIEAITFVNDGKARDQDLKNIFLVDVQGNISSSVAQQLDGDRVRLTFDPHFLLGKNNDVLLYLKADVLASRRKTIQLLIEEPSDIEATAARTRSRKIR